MREQRVGEEVDRPLQRVELLGVVDVLDERAVDGLDRVSDHVVLLGEALDHRRQTGLAGEVGKTALSSSEWCWATTRQ